MATTVLTLGHGTHAQDAFEHLVRSAGVQTLVDIRIGPGSKRHPQFNRAEMERWLPEAGVSYRWEQRLGGFRRLPPDSPDTGLRNDSFRAYASHMRTPEFRAAIAELLPEAAERTTAIMCSESVWWRCHRRLVSDYLVLIEGVTVQHLMPDGRLVPHPPTEVARVEGDELVYDRTPAGEATED